jgi:hypothetical protein
MSETEQIEEFTVWKVESPEGTVIVNRVVDLNAHICDLAMCYLAPGDKVTITASEMTREEWETLPEFEGK